LEDIEGSFAAAYNEPMSEAHKAVAQAVFEVWSTGELDRLDALVAERVVHHDRYDPNAADGLAGMKRTIAANRERSRICT
jgi:ketosteroid isomerase-like protein